MTTIRLATFKDLEEIFNLYIDNNPEFGKNHKRLKSGLTTLLRDSNKGHEVVAVANNKIIGRIHVSTQWSVYRNSNFWVFENVYISPEWRRKKIYTIMNKWIYSHAKKDPNCCGLRFWTPKENYPARNAYRKLNMDSTIVELFENDFIFGKDYN